MPARKTHYLEGLRAAAAEEKAAEQKAGEQNQLQHSKCMAHIAQGHPQQPGSSTMQLEAQPTAPLRMSAGHFLADFQLGLGGNQAVAAAPSTATALQAAQPFRHSPQFLPSSRLPAEALPSGPTMALLQSLRQQQQHLQGQHLSSGLQPSQPAQQQPSLEQMAYPSISSVLPSSCLVTRFLGLQHDP